MIFSNMLLLIATYLILFNMAKGIPMYVTPNITTDPCPGTPCWEWNAYVHNASSYFLSDAMFTFLPGIHFLDYHVIVANKDNLQMIGSSNLTQYPISVKVQEYGFDSYDEDNNVTYLESSTYITCTTYKDSGFVFVNITNLTITNITIVNCGVYFNLTDQNAGIHMINVFNLLMGGVSIQNSIGYGLLGVNLLGHTQIIGSSFIGNNQFIKNGLSRQSAYHFKCNGKAYINDTLYYGNGDAMLAGGNMVIDYQDYGDYLESNQIDLSGLVLSLGMDASFNYTSMCNSQKYEGTGLSLILNQTYDINITIQNSTFYRNQAGCGANIYLYDLSANFGLTIYNVFITRAVSIFYSGLYIRYSISHTIVPVHAFLYIHNAIFLCNYADQDQSSFQLDTIGMVLPTDQISLQVKLENCNFISDYFSSGYAIGIVLNSVVTITFEQCSLSNMSITTLSDKCLFSFDECIVQDSSISAHSAVVSITNSTFFNSGIYVSSGTIINMKGIVYAAGSVISLTSSTIVFSPLSNVTFCNNKAPYGGAISMIISATMVFSPQSYVTFLNNSATYGGAIYSSSATMVFSPRSHVTFLNNSATYGGAIYMENESYLNYSSPTNVTFMNNTASQTGGAIYVMTSQVYHMPLCFYQYNATRGKDSFADIYIYFEGNIAREAGNAIYGGDIDNCQLLYCSTSCTTTPYFDHTHHFGGNHDNTTSLISSDACYICQCDRIDHCNQVTAAVNKLVYPGEKINIDFVTVGQRHGISPSDVLLYTENKAPAYSFALRSTNKCKSYEIPNVSINGSLYLSTELSFYSGRSSLYNINISILLLPCPAGFMYEPLSSSCICDIMLKGYVFRCSINSDNQTLQKSGNAWIGNNPQGHLSVIDPCPSDYCKTTDIIAVSDLNSQCNYNRVDVACGHCHPSLSMTFGTSQCKSCTNVYLLLVIPFAIMGMALIVFMMLFNFTVSSGTINGIVLYAFILRVYKDVFFPTSSGAVANVLNILSVFIAWLNLDLGIETCFYNGMDSYSKVWLQFSFLLYMVALVAAIIVVSRLSSVISRLCRYNMIPVISTLMILFYAKSLRIVTTIFTPAIIQSDVSSYVWCYDGTIPYLGPKHALLFTAGLVVTIFFIVPYTAVMLLTPWLMSKSHWKVMCWMNKLRPFIDCYEAPFKDRYRFWTGATLFYRIVFCIVFAIFSGKEPTIVLLIIIVIHASMIVMAGLAIYKNWLVSILEGFFHINIVIHSLALFFMRKNQNTNISAIPSVVLVGSSFVCFVCMFLLKFVNFMWKRNYFNLACLHYATLTEEDVAVNEESTVTDLERKFEH